MLMNDRQNRREFVRELGRYPMLALLTMVGAILVSRRWRMAEGDRCRQRTPCQECRELSACRLPPALSLKNHLTQS